MKWIFSVEYGHAGHVGQAAGGHSGHNGHSQQRSSSLDRHNKPRRDKAGPYRQVHHIDLIDLLT